MRYFESAVQVVSVSGNARMNLRMKRKPERGGWDRGLVAAFQNKHLTDWRYLNISQRAALADEMV